MTWYRVGIQTRARSFCLFSLINTATNVTMSYQWLYCYWQQWDMLRHAFCVHVVLSLNSESFSAPTMQTWQFLFHKLHCVLQLYKNDECTRVTAGVLPQRGVRWSCGDLLNVFFFVCCFCAESHLAEKQHSKVTVENIRAALWVTWMTT